jgi:hypothetical protein
VTKNCTNCLGVFGYSVNTADQTSNTAFRLLSRRELADRWSMSTETLKRRERCGLLPFLKLGRGVRYRLADIERLEAEATIGGTK